MGEKTGIGWTQATWNCVTGCDRVSPGCDHCYALDLAARLKATGNPRYQRDGNPRTSGPGFGLTLHHDKLDQPLHWKRPRMIFVNSMSDLFHDDVPDEFIAKVFAVMALSSQHTFQVLTKRPRRMQALLGNNPSWCLSIAQEFLALVPEMGRTLFHERWPGWPIPNVWLGASVEDQKRADLRIPLLLETPAAVRFLSCEPLLGPLDLWAKASNRGGIFTNCPECDGWGGRIRGTGEHGGFDTKCFGCNGAKIVPGVSWIICGGESGSGYRPMEIEWAQGLADMCEKVGIPFFMKQDSGPRPGTQGRIPDDLWARKEFPR